MVDVPAIPRFVRLPPINLPITPTSSLNDWFTTTFKSALLFPSKVPLNSAKCQSASFVLIPFWVMLLTSIVSPSLKFTPEVNAKAYSILFLFSV